MIKYLGKKTIHDRLKAVSEELGVNIPKIKECEYNFYRGDEWLRWTAVHQVGEYLQLIEEVEARVFAPKDETNGRPIMHVWVKQSIENNVEVLQETISHYTYKNTECFYRLIKFNDKSQEWVKGITDKEA